MSEYGCRPIHEMIQNGSILRKPQVLCRTSILSCYCACTFILAH